MIRSSTKPADAFSKPEPCCSEASRALQAEHKLLGEFGVARPSATCSIGRMHLRRARSLGHHHLDELLVIYLSVSVHVRLPDHLVDLLVRELLAKVCHHVAQLCGADEAVPIAVEHL